MKTKLLVISQNIGESYPQYFKRVQAKVDEIDKNCMIVPVSVNNIVHSYVQWLEPEPFEPESI